MAVQSETATQSDVEEIEIKLLLDGVCMRYGYDFRDYALGPLRRSIAAGMAGEGVPTISSYQERLLHDASCMQRFLSSVGAMIFCPESSRYEQTRDGVNLFHKVR